MGQITTEDDTIRKEEKEIEMIKMKVSIFVTRAQITNGPIGERLKG